MNREDDSDRELDAQAAAFVVRVHAEDADEADWLALETWLAAGAAHLDAYDRAERLWAEFGDAAVVEIEAELLSDEPDPAVIDLTARRAPRVRWLAPLSGAAAIAAGLLVVVMLQPPAPQVYQTAAGETREVVLADGSKIHLNGASKLTVSLGRRERRVEMDFAEASFDVARDARRPFLVDVGETEVRVVGTEFNITRDRAATTVTVRRGIVEVRPGQGAGAVRLTAGKELRHFAGRTGEIVRETDPNLAFAWQGGRLIYDNESLADIAADLSRQFPVPVKVEGPAANLRFTGVLILDGPDAVIGRLETFLPVKVHRGSDAITITRR